MDLKYIDVYKIHLVKNGMKTWYYFLSYVTICGAG